MVYAERASVRVIGHCYPYLQEVEVEYLTDEVSEGYEIIPYRVVLVRHGGARSQVGRRVVMLETTLRSKYRLQEEPCVTK